MKRNRYVCCVGLFLLLTGCSNSEEIGDNTRTEANSEYTAIYETENDASSVASDEETTLEDDKLKEEDIVYTEFPKSYKRDGVRVKIDVNIDTNKAYFISGRAKRRSFDSEGIVEGLKIYDDYIRNDYTEIGAYELIHFDDDPLKSQDILAGDDFVDYNSGYSGKYSTSVYTEEVDKMYNLTEYKEKIDFDFGNADKYVKELFELLEKHGVDTSNMEASVYYLSNEKLKEKESHLQGSDISEEYNEWSEEDDAYLIYLHYKYCGMDFYDTYGLASGSISEMMSPVVVKYTKRGIISMYISVSDIVEGDKSETLLPFESIADTVIDYFDETVDTTEITIFKASLVSDVDAEGNVFPEWVFLYDENYGDSVSRRELCVNAISGKIVYHE